jgi:FKBP-type peptidyl-prolyl cis-trans isomerase
MNGKRYMKTVLNRNDKISIMTMVILYKITIQSDTVAIILPNFLTEINKKHIFATQFKTINKNIMKSRKLVYIFSILFSVLLAQCQTGTNKDYSKVKLTDELDTASYYLGTLWGRGAVYNKITELDYESLLKGIDQALNNDSTIPPDYIASTYLNRYVNKMVDKTLREQHVEDIEKNVRFLEENAKKEGVITLSSGLQYKILKEGTGELPTLQDQVRTHYTGKLIDGTVFDSSVERGEPALINLNNVMPGFREALLLMPVGSKWQIFIPEKLGYGAHSQNPVPPFSTLIFEVESIEIVKKEK